MSESQSRFSIVDELIQKKNNTQVQINSAEQAISDAEFNLKNWEKTVILERERITAQFEKTKKDKAKEIEMLKQILSEYDKGLIAVQNISKEQTK